MMTITTFHVSEGGNDGNSGKSFDDAFATLQRADEACVSDRGDTVLIYPGVYNQRLDTSKSGVNWRGADPDNMPVVWSEAERDWEAVLRFRKGCVVENIEVHGKKADPNAYYLDYGIKVGGSDWQDINDEHIAIRNCVVHHTGSSAILGHYQKGLLVEGCEVYLAAMRNYERRCWTWDPPGADGEKWHPAAVSLTRGWDYVFANNYVHGNWGEGAGFDFGVWNLKAYGNYIGICWSSKLYVGEAKDAFVYNNVLWNPQGEFSMVGGVANCLGLDDESYTAHVTDPDNVHFYNNLAINGRSGIWLGHGFDERNTKNVFFYNNTIVALDQGRHGVTVSGDGAYENVNVTDNIFFISEGAKPGKCGRNVMFDRNLWNVHPGWYEPNGEVADPKLFNPGAVILSSGRNAVNLDDYKVKPNSPAIARGMKALGDDLAGNARPSPPITLGAFEYGDVVPDEPEEVIANEKHVGYDGRHHNKLPSTIGRGSFLKAGTYADLANPAAIAAVNRNKGVFYMLLKLGDMAPDNGLPLNSFEFYGWRQSTKKSSLIKCGADMDRSLAFWEMWADDKDGSNGARIVANLEGVNLLEQFVIGVEYEHNGIDRYAVRAFLNGVQVGAGTAVGIWTGVDHIMHVGSPKEYGWHGDAADLIHFSGVTLSAKQHLQLAQDMLDDRVSYQMLENIHPIHMIWGLRDKNVTAPASVEVEQPVVATGSYEIQWSVSADAHYYELHETKDPNSLQSRWDAIYLGDDTKCFVERAPGEYAYRVIACNDAGHSLYSNVVTVVVQNDAPKIVSLQGTLTAVIEANGETYVEEVEVSSIAP